MAVTLDQIKGLLEQAIRETVQQMSASPSRAPRERRYRPRLKDDGMGKANKAKGGRGQWGDDGGALAEDEEAIYWQTQYEALKASRCARFSFSLSLSFSLSPSLSLSLSVPL